MSSPLLLRAENLGKRFGASVALSSVSASFERGRIYGLAGQNGAGKSTLVKIISGVHPEHEGRMEFDGKPFAPRNVAAAELAGVSVFHQEIPICPNLSVAANVFLGRSLPGPWLFPEWRQMEARCEQLFGDWLGLSLDPGRRMGECSAAERQLALLVRVLARRARLIILDEPTTALTPAEVSQLFVIIRRLAAEGVTFVFVSHLLDELMELCDTVLVLRDGELAGELPRGSFDSAELARMIVGSAAAEHAAGAGAGSRAARHELQLDSVPRLDVRSLSRRGDFQDVSFTVKPGEILGITGLQGSGRSGIARALFASPPADSGELWLDGHKLALRQPQDAVGAGIGYVPEDRKTLGLFPDLDVQTNLGLLRLDSMSRLGWLARSQLTTLTEQFQPRLQIRMPHAQALITSLSGGNQQKVLLARWLSIGPKLLVLQEPTRGVDIGARREIQEILREVAAQGTSIVLSSPDPEDLIGLADRVLVLTSGRVTAELIGDAITKPALVHAAGRRGTPTL